MFYKGKRVLVTGGSGFVGSHLAEALLGRGARVRITVHRRPSRLGTAVEEVTADLENAADCRRAMEGMDYVFHGAGAVAAAGVTASGPVDAIADNLVLTARVVQGAMAARVRALLLFGSSTGYPDVHHAVTEDEMWDGEPPAVYFGYGWMRRYMEKLGAFAAAGSPGLRVILVRPTAVYGPWDDFDPHTGHVIPALIRKAVERMDPFEVWGTGDEIRDFLHVRDLAAGCLLAMERGKSCDPVNIGYGEAVTIRQVVSHILDAADYRDARVVFNASRPTTIPVRRVSTEKAVARLGFRPAVSLAEGLAETVAWYRRREREGT